jgi:hypothetical protein
MWLTVTVITLLAAIGFGVLALVVQWWEWAQKADAENS